MKTPRKYRKPSLGIRGSRKKFVALYQKPKRKKKKRKKQKTAKPFVRPDYHIYILSKKWEKKREKALVLADHQCEICTSSFHLSVHHLTYERLGREIPSDLQVLCEDCHLMAHEDKPGIARDSLTEEYHAIMGGER